LGATGLPCMKMPGLLPWIVTLGAIGRRTPLRRMPRARPVGLLRWVLFGRRAPFRRMPRARPVGLLRWVLFGRRAPLRRMPRARPVGSLRWVLLDAERLSAECHGLVPWIVTLGAIGRRTPLRRMPRARPVGLLRWRLAGPPGQRCGPMVMVKVLAASAAGKPARCGYNELEETTNDALGNRNSGQLEGRTNSEKR
jgi:hypothetical protein